jgi:hypothetical protein
MTTEYRFIRFVPDGEFEGKPMWSCANRKSGGELAKVFYYRLWRQFCVRVTAEQNVFSYDCLEDIAHFLRQLNDRPN